MRIGFKTIGICIAVLGASLLIVAAVLFSYAHSDHFREMMVKKVNASIAGRLTIGGHDISFLRGEIVLRNLTLTDLSGRRLATLDSLLANIAWRPLLSGTLLFENIGLEHPDVRLGMDKAGDVDIVRILTPSHQNRKTPVGKSPGFPFKVATRRVRITDGNVHLTTEPDGLRMDLKGMTLEARGNLFEKSAEIRIKAAQTVLDDGRHHLDIHPAALSGVLQENRFESLVLEAKTDFARIRLDGDVREAFRDPVLNLKLTFDVAIPGLNGSITLPPGYSGKTEGVMTVQGKWRDPDVSLNLVYDGGLLAGYSVEALRAEMIMKQRRLSVRELAIRAGSGEMRFDGKVNLQEALLNDLTSLEIRPEKIAYSMHAGLKHIDIAFLTGGSGRAGGFLDSEISIEGQGIDLKKLSAAGTIDAVFKKFSSEGIQRPADLHLQASATIKAGLLDVSRLSLKAADTRLNARGTVDMPTGNIRGSVTADTENITDPLSLFGISGPSGSCSVKAEVGGSWKRPDLDIDLTARQFRKNGLRLGDVRLAARLDPTGLLEIKSATLENRGTRARGKGKLQLFKDGFRLHPSMPLRADLTIIKAQPRDFSGDGPVNGSFEGDLQFGGSLRSLQVSAVMRGENVTYQKLMLGDMDTRLRFYDGGFHLDRFQLEKQGATYSLSGDIQVFQPASWQGLKEPVVDLGIKGQDVSPADFLHDLQGKLFLEARLKGPLSRLEGRGTLEGKGLDFNGQRAQRVVMDMELKENRLHLSTLQAYIDPGGVVTGAGWIGFDRRFALDLYSTAMPLGCIDRIRQMKNVEGQMDFHVHGDGHLSDPSLYGDIHIGSVRINHEEMDDFRFRIDLVHRQLSVEGHQAFDLNLAYHLVNRDYSMDLLFDDTDIAPFLLVAGTKDIGGRLSGKISAAGNTAFLEKSQALLDLSELSLTYNGELLAHTDGVRGSLSNRQLSIPEFELNFLQSGRLTVKGVWNFDGYVDLTADGGVPARAAMLFVKEVTDVAGAIRLHAELKGSAAEPTLSGEIRLDDVGFTLPQTDTSFKDVSGGIRLTSSHMFIEKLNGMMNSGTFQMEGDMTLKKYRPDLLRLEVKTGKIPISIPETMDVLVDTDLVLAGPLENLILEGDIVLLEGLYYKNINVNPLQGMKEKKRAENLSAQKANRSFRQKIRFDIQLKYREPFMVDNNIAHLEIQPDLVLSGTWEDPVITGMAKVSGGTITYQRRVFEVEKGIVNFNNPYEIEPEIDMAGSVQISRWRISLTMSGTPERLVVELSSTPWEGDADILSLLLFGKTTYEMRGANNTSVESTEALLAQVMASSFGADVKKTTGLDYLEVETNTGEAGSDSDSIRVTMGKDLTERLTAKYTIGSGRSGYYQRTATEYKLIEHILLSGFQDIEGNYGGEIIFRVEFRMFP